MPNSKELVDLEKDFFYELVIALLEEIDEEGFEKAKKRAIDESF